MTSPKTKKRQIRLEDPPVEGQSSLWLIIYTDMISNLMIFFLMLYCLTWLSEADRNLAAASFKETFGGEKGAVLKTLAEIEKGIDKTKDLEDKVKQEFQNVQISEKKITIILPSPVLFDSGKADLKPSTIKNLRDIAEVVRNLPNRVVVEGYTDDIPIQTERFKSNWELSSARAFSVVQYLIEKEKISPNRVSALGYAEFRPSAPNDSESNRAKNRKIEINIMKQQDINVSE
ncbi:MAG: OmpA family protein [Elusimicrobiota bacterium]